MVIGINGCGQWLFLEVNLYCFYSLGSWDGCWLLVGVERWLLLEFYNVLVLCRGHLVWFLPRGWLLFGGVVKRGFTLFVFS